MAFLLHTPPTADVAVQQMSVLRSQAQAVTATSYRCAGCGEVLHFNALATSCRCIDECYTEPARNATEPDGRDSA